jgi:membrane-associated phospholipid phosphatase
MFKTVRENRFYFSLVAIFALVGGIVVWQTDKASAIFFFSEHRSAFLDWAFKAITRMGEGPVYFVVAIAALMVRVRWAILVAVTGLSVMGLSKLLKSYFEVFRPYSFFAKQNLLEKINMVAGVDLHVGTTSFPSGHAMSAFAFYSLLVFLLPAKKRYVAILFLLALLVAISRVYLVQHFWADVYAGGVMGVGVAMVVFAAQKLLLTEEDGWLDRPIGGGSFSWKGRKFKTNE